MPEMTTEANRLTMWEFRGLMLSELQKARKERGISARRLSEQLGMPPYAVSNIENGMALIPKRTAAYCEWAGLEVDFFPILAWLEERLTR